MTSEWPHNNCFSYIIIVLSGVLHSSMTTVVSVQIKTGNLRAQDINNIQITMKLIPLLAFLLLKFTIKRQYTSDDKYFCLSGKGRKGTKRQIYKSQFKLCTLGDKILLYVRFLLKEAINKTYLQNTN